MGARRKRNRDASAVVLIAIVVLGIGAAVGLVLVVNTTPSRGDPVPRLVTQAPSPTGSAAFLADVRQGVPAAHIQGADNRSLLLLGSLVCRNLLQESDPAYRMTRADIELLIGVARQDLCPAAPS